MANTILVVEDEPAVREAVEEALETEEGLEVVTADDAEGALDLLRAQPVALVLAADGPPDAQGASLLDRVGQLFPDVSRLQLTEGSRPGPQALPSVAKPVVREALVDAIRSALADRSRNKEQTALIEYGGVTPVQIERAQRIQQRLQNQRPLGEVLVELGELSREAYEQVLRRRRARLTLVELLCEDGRLSDEDLSVYQRAKAAEPQLSDRDILVGKNLVSEEHFLRAQCAKLDVPYEQPDIGAIDSQLLSKTSFRYLLRHNVLPVRIEDNKLRVILADPQDDGLVLELQRTFGRPIVRAACTAARIAETLRTLEHLGGKASEGEKATLLQYRELDKLPESVDETGEEAVQIVDYLLSRAIQLNASDLHIEALQSKMRVRVRIDGALHHLTDLPADFAPRVVSRVKVLAGADIAEKRLHQDGKICVKIGGREIDIRVSTYASVHGETVVMRLLDRDRGLLPVEEIGFQPRPFASLTEVVLQSSSGLVLIVGPTGSGKTTTLYSFIGHANDPSEKVITCEDPVEYVIDGVIQCSVNDKRGPTFSDSLRAIVRQDPDTIVVGEIRDKTTANLALEAALTGHKVFSTFHTEDAVGAFLRLLEMGAESFLVASMVSAVVAQRLVRRLCPECKKHAQATRPEMRFLSLERAELLGAQLWAHGECTRCNGTGFRGRLAIHEVLLPGDDFRDAVLRRASSRELREQARRLPEFLTMQEDGVLKAIEGLTTLAEVIENAPRDATPRSLAALRSISQAGKVG